MANGNERTAAMRRSVRRNVRNHLRMLEITVEYSIQQFRETAAALVNKCEAELWNAKDKTAAWQEMIQDKRNAQMLVIDYIDEWLAEKDQNQE